MTLLALGLALFVLVHAVPMVPPLRAVLVARVGADPWRGIHSLIALVGMGLIVWGFAWARAAGPDPWLTPQVGLRHAALLVLLPVFPLIFASFRPGWIARRVGHPMVTGVVLWAAGHLLAVSSAPAVLLASVFLVWGLAARLSLARRKPATGPIPPFGRADLVAIVAGVAVWGLLLWKGHLWLIGIAPLP